MWLSMKRTFKDFFKQDIERVFFNKDEFAELVIIEGTEMQIVRNSDGIYPGDIKYQVATFDIVFHVASTYFEYIPQTEKLMNFDGEDYLIKSVQNNLGILTIGLSRNDS